MKLALLLGAALAPLALVQPAFASDQIVGAAASAPAAVNAAEVIYGRVTNASGQPLPGAEVVVRGGGQRVVSNTQGEFMLPVRAGQISFDVNYLGLPSTSQTVTVASGESPRVVVALGGADATSLEDVVVTGVITDGVARSLNQQRSADGTINVLSSDAIGRYPDPNVAESLQRVAGVAIQRDQGEGRYINVRGAPSAFTAVSVDGVTIPSVDSSTRAVDLDTLPSDIVNTLEVSKTLLPSQDADSIAGAVNITTRSAFDQRRLRVNGYLGGSYNDYGGSDTRAGATVSNVFGADQTFGGLLSLSYSETNRRPDNVESGWTKMETPDGTEVFALEESLFKDYETTRTRMAATGALEWRPTDSFRAYLRGSYAQFEDDEYRNQLLLTYDEDGLRNGATDASATFDDVTVERQLRHRTQQNDIFTLSAGAAHNFENGVTWDYNLSLASSEQTYPNRNELLFRSTNTPTVTYDFSADHRQPTYSIFQTEEHLNAADYVFRENAFRSNTTKQEEFAAQTNMVVPTLIGGHGVDWSFGLKFASRDVSADEERLRDRRAASRPAQTYADLMTDRPSQNYDYFLGPKFNYGLVDAYFAQARATSQRRMPDSIIADYEAQEDILAGYAQARADLGRANIVAGLRIEQTRFDGSATAYNADDDTYSPREVSRDYTDFFPNLTVRYAFSDDLIGRFALTRAISRPEYNDIVPRSVEETDGSVIEVELGNPDLNPTLSNNFDAGLEYYLRPLGVISANVFYKDLSDYRYTLTLDGTYNGDPARLTRVENAPDGHLAGLELNWQQTFSFLPGWASGFGVFANYTLTDAEIDLGRTYEGRSVFALPGQSDTTYNLAAFYEMGGFSARLSYTKRSDYLEEINADDGDFDLYVEGREQLDFTTSYEFSNGMELFAEAKNLTDSPGVRYYGSRERTYEYEKFGYNVFVGLRFKL
jgi:TonB-dependent receptor